MNDSTNALDCAKVCLVQLIWSEGSIKDKITVNSAIFFANFSIIISIFKYP